MQAHFVHAQYIDLEQEPEEDPISWESYSLDLGDNEFLLTFEASINNGWYIYSQHIEQTPPLPTNFNFNNPEEIVLQGDIEEVGNAIEVFDETFETSIKKYANKVAFQVIVKSLLPQTVLNASVEYMTCNDYRCLPPELEQFTFNLSNKSDVRFTASPVNPEEENFRTLGTKKHASEDFIVPEKTMTLLEPKPIDLVVDAEIAKKENMSDVIKDETLFDSRDINNEARTVKITDKNNSGMLVADNAFDFIDDDELADLFKKPPSKKKKTTKVAEKKEIPTVKEVTEKIAEIIPEKITQPIQKVTEKIAETTHTPLATTKTVSYTNKYTHQFTQTFNKYSQRFTQTLNKITTNLYVIKANDFTKTYWKWLLGGLILVLSAITGIQYARKS